MYRRINPTSRLELPRRMLFQPTGSGTFFRACEADDDPSYETADVETRLVARLRIAHDVELLFKVEGRHLAIGDRDGPDTINVATDETFIRSLDKLGFVSLAAPGAP